MNNGFILLHRDLLKWEWYNDNNTKSLFIHILLKTNHKAKKWQGIDIPKGSFLTGRKKLSLETGLTEQQIRTCLNKLKSTNEITIKATNLNSLISVVNWNIYQAINQQTTKRVTNEQPTDNQRVTTTNNDNKDNNVNNDNKIVDKIYNLYPTKCPFNNSSTGKSIKDKDKIKNILKDISPNDLILTIETYIEDCKKSNRYLKNFKTFLNNLPDYKTTIPIKKEVYYWKIAFTNFHGSKEKYDKALNLQPNSVKLIKIA